MEGVISNLIIPQDYYACVDLIDSCFRMNIVALAKELMEERDPINSYDDLHQLVVDLLSMINTWRKYERGSLNDCPNLAKTEEVRVEEAPEAAHMVDLNIDSCPPTKHLKSDDEDCDSFGEEEEPARDEDNRAEESQQKPDQYREYMMGQCTSNHCPCNLKDD